MAIACHPIASELAYLAFLGAQATKVAELLDMVDEIERAKREIIAGKAQEVGDQANAEGEGASSKTKRLTQVVNDLEARADALCRQLGFLFGKSAGSPRSESGQPTTS